MHDAGVVEVKGTTNPGHEPLAIWDDVMNEPVLAGPDELPDPAEDTIDPPRVEDHTIPLPSNGSIGTAYAELEMSHCITHAEYHINWLCILIAKRVSNIHM